MTASPASEDADLVRRCRSGDGTAWEALVRRYQRLVYAIARRAGLDEHAAADVFQTVFTRLFEGLARIQEPDRLQAWIVTTAKRETLLLLKRGQRTVSMTSEAEPGEEPAEWDIPDEGPLPEDALAELQELDRVREGLERLDERCRGLLRLLFQEGEDAVSYEAISRELGLAIGSIGPTRARCLDKLRRLIG